MERIQCKTYLCKCSEILFKPNDDLGEPIDTFFRIDGAVFVTPCQYIVAKALVRQPEAYTDLVQTENGADKQFQSDKNIAAMTDFIVKSVVSLSCKNRSVDTRDRRNLLSAFDSVLPTAKDSRPTTSTLHTPAVLTASFSFTTVRVKQEHANNENATTEVEPETTTEVHIEL